MGTPKRLRIAHSAEIVSMLRTGNRRTSADLQVIFNENEAGSDRLAVLVSRRLGSSVQRNRLKRCVREMVRLAVVPVGDNRRGLNLVIRPCAFQNYNPERARTWYRQWRESFGD